MKIILLKDVAHIGQKGDIREVKDGHGRNFLIPRGFAAIADEQSIHDAELKKQSIAKKIQSQKENISEYIKRLSSTELTITQKANKKGHLFASVSVGDVVKLLHKKSCTFIKQNHITDGLPIKEIGDHVVKIRIHDKTVDIKIHINAL